MLRLSAKKRAYARALDAMMAASDAATIAVNGDGVVIAANPWAYRLFAWPAENGLIGQKVEALVPADRRAKHAHLREGYNEVPVRRPMGIGMEVHGQRYDGSVFPAEVGLAPLNGWTVAVIKPVGESDARA